MVEIQTSPQETAELTVQTQQEKISKAIEDIKRESNENFNNVNELINKNFYDNIEQWQAENIIKIIDDLFTQWLYNKDLKDLKEFLEPKAAKTISSQQENFEKEVDQEFRNLPDLDTNSIKVFSDLDKNKIVNFFNEQKAREDLTHEQKYWLTLAYEWLTKRFIDSNDGINRWKESITVLQQYMKDNDKRIVIDWKFGKQTFDAMKRYLSGETATVNSNDTNETSDINNNSSEVMFGDERLLIKEEDGRKFVEINWNRYYEYENGMNWLWYRNGINNNSQKWTYIWDYVDGNEEWNWTITRDNEEKYEWNWKNGKREWKGTYTRASGAKHEWNWENNKMEWEGTYTLANNRGKYEWEFKENHGEWRWTRTWANWNSVKWTFTKTDKSMFGLKTPTKFIDDSGEYEVVRDNELLKVVSKWEYEGKYISLEKWEFVDTPSTNHDSDQDNDQADNTKDNKSKQREQFQKYKKLNEEIQKLRNGESYEYKINDDIIFTFTKEKCILNDSGKEITFNNRSKKWFSYRIEPNKYITIKPNFIDIYDISKGMNKLYYQDGSWRKKFEWYTDNYWNPKEWIMTYNNGSKFEWNFIVWDTLKEWERHNVSFKEDDFWD